MKHCHPVIILICALTFTNAMALDSSTITTTICTPAEECQGGPYIMTGCEDVTCTKYKLGSPSSIPGVEQITTEITSCDKCSDGYTRTSKSVQCGTSTIIAYTCTKDQLAACINCSCTDQTDTVVNGYLKTVKQDCDPNNDCKCATSSTTYSCESDYYQSGSSVTCTYKQSGSYQCSGCTACPSNATCNGGTTFTCNSGYYESESSCAKCPDNYATCSGTTFTCKDGYYKSNNQCVVCPDNATCTDNNMQCEQNFYQSGGKCEPCGSITVDGEKINMTTDAAGATNKSACHLPDDVANTTYNTTYNGHNVTVRLTGSCSKN